MNKKLATLGANDTLSLTTLPDNRRAISSKWVYKTKYNPDVSVERQKSSEDGNGATSKEKRDIAIRDALGIKNNIINKNNGEPGMDTKQKWLRNSFFHENFDLVGVQESKMKNINLPFIHSIWGSDVDFVFIGASGGTLHVWNCNSFLKEGCLIGSNFCGIFGNWNGVNDQAITKALWRELSSVLLSIDGTWILMGDFNVVRFESERAGSVFEEKEAADFNDFIATLGLHDFQMGGRKFTWFNRSGSKMSKLDFLVNSSFFNSWQNAIVTAHERVISDHNPITLSIESSDSGPKPFRVFDSWMGVDGFDKVIVDSWNSGLYNGSPDIILKNKIKRLRNDIKAWSHNHIAEANQALGEALGRLRDWDLKAEMGAILHSDIDSRDEDRAFIQRLDQQRNNDLKQKSRIK
nr:RNA-directed DNA polymerase, eukaryota [Tanacetum cinerariifolium]